MDIVEKAIKFYWIWFVIMLIVGTIQIVFDITY